MRGIICKIQQNGKIDGKFKIVNPIFGDKNFVKDALEVHPKTFNAKSYIPKESVDTESINSKTENYDNDNYDDILFNKVFTD